MSKRLQVLYSDHEYAELEAAAAAAGQSVSEWVRSSLREARRNRSSADRRAKLDAIRLAFDHSYPTADIEEMLREVESGRLT